MAEVSLGLLPRAPDSFDPDFAAVARDLRTAIEGEVRFGRHDRMLYATDASLYQVEPLGVVVPRSVDELEPIVRIAARHGLSLLPRGGGTSLAGQTVNRSLVIDCSAYCRGIADIDAEARTARVEPGVVLDQLNASLAPRGLAFGPDVATSTHATLGGMIGNNSAGARSILHGRTVEHLIGLDAILADGTRVRLEEGAAARDERVHDLTRRVVEVVTPLATRIRARFPRIVRHVDGYNFDLLLDQIERSSPGGFDRVNLAHLVCGSEGTLAITREATLNLVPLPRARGLAIASYGSLDAALADLSAILATRPSAVELLDEMVIDLAKKNREYRRYVDLLPLTREGEARACLYVEYSVDDEAELLGRFEALRQAIPGAGLEVFDRPRAVASAWKLRKAGEPILHAMTGGRKPLSFIEDTAVAPEALPEFVAEFRAIVERHGTAAAYYAHASVGCLHIRPFLDPHEEADRRAMEAIAREVTDLVRRHGGALSGEHGDGRARSHLLERFYGPEICEGFRKVKAIFDPENRLNPGNLVTPAPMAEALRVKPGERTLRVPEVETYFRYEKDHGFAEAVELCNGAGVCRKMEGGSMCPSYRALRDERHATRGRANALRLAITGQLGDEAGGAPAWGNADTLQTLDLCLSCKACKTECPSNVDVARLKAEYLAQSFDAGTRPGWRTRIFGNVRAVNRLGSAVAPLANAMSRGLAGRVGKGILGIDPRRSLPPFGPSLAKWFRRSEFVGRDASRPAVVLLPDCFAMYNEPGVGRAAIELLDRLGYRVVLPETGCCGRPLISLGLLREARPVIERTGRDLLRTMREERALGLVALEPSCLSAIKDDWLDLRLDLPDGDRTWLAERSMLVEEFVNDRWEDHPRRPRPTVATRRVLLHGHCHQKALWGAESSADALGRVCGEGLATLDSGCCGMAGAFGMTRERYALSMAVGERSLFEALRAEPDAAVAAPGTSCRHQIFDALGRRALHPVEVLAEALDVERPGASGG